jgi:hypothetical protein
MVSSDLEGANKKNYKQVLRADDPGDEEGLKQPDPTDFVTLQRGSAIEFEENVTVYLFNAKKPSEQFLSEGTYVLQVVVGGWPYIANPKPFRKKWRHKGYLWVDGITSEPMAFTIGKNRSLVNCK